jgi:hypothetical protein
MFLQVAAGSQVPAVFVLTIASLNVPRAAGLIRHIVCSADPAVSSFRPAKSQSAPVRCVGQYGHEHRHHAAESQAESARSATADLAIFYEKRPQKRKNRVG